MTRTPSSSSSPPLVYIHPLHTPLTGRPLSRLSPLASSPVPSIFRSIDPQFLWEPKDPSGQRRADPTQAAITQQLERTTRPSPALLPSVSLSSHPSKLNSKRAGDARRSLPGREIGHGPEGAVHVRRRAGPAPPLLRGDLHPEPHRRVRPGGPPRADPVLGARLRRRRLRRALRDHAAGVRRRRRAPPGRAVVGAGAPAGDRGGARRGALAPGPGAGARRHCAGDALPAARRRGGGGDGRRRRRLRGRGCRRALGGGAGGVPQGRPGAAVLDGLPVPHRGRDAVQCWHQRPGLQAWPADHQRPAAPSRHRKWGDRDMLTHREPGPILRSSWWPWPVWYHHEGKDSSPTCSSKGEMGEGLLRQLRNIHQGPRVPDLNAGAGGLRGGVHGSERALHRQLVHRLPRPHRFQPRLRLPWQEENLLLLHRVRSARLPAGRRLQHRPCCGAGLRGDELREAPHVQRGGVLLRFPQQGEDGGGEPEEAGAVGRAPPLAQHVRAQAWHRSPQGPARGHRLGWTLRRGDPRLPAAR